MKKLDKTNVEEGDLLIINSCQRFPKAFPIEDVRDNWVGARNETGEETIRPYFYAIVLKSDGTYLIGDGAR